MFCSDCCAPRLLYRPHKVCFHRARCSQERKRVFSAAHIFTSEISQLEQTGSTIFQTLAGLSLDVSKQDTTMQYLLNTFVALNILQFFSILAMAYLDGLRQRKTLPRHTGLEIRLTKSLDDRMIDGNLSGEERALLFESTPHSQYSSASTARPYVLKEDNFELDRRVRRGEFFVKLCGGLIVLAWVLFLTTAWMRLRSKKERGF
jgi:hypothetical protein